MYRRGYILLCFYSVKTAYLPVGHHQLQYLQTIYRHFHSIQIGNVTDDIKNIDDKDNGSIDSRFRTAYNKKRKRE